MRILIVEDEEKTAASVMQGLMEQGFDATVVSRGDEGLLRAKTESYDLILLDLMLPGRDGWEILRALRGAGNGTPILCLTARDGVGDRVRGLELGADDYLVKPFALAELIARVRTVLRRGAHPSPRMSVADLNLDLIRRRASRRGAELDLTPTEFSLLAFLAEHRGEALTRAMISDAVWGMPLDGASNVIDVAVRRLRAKVEIPGGPPLIHTVRGVGYVFALG